MSSNTLPVQTKIITAAIDNSPFLVRDSIVRFEDFAAIAAYGDCKIQVTQTSIGKYKLAHLNAGWGANKNYRPEAHSLDSLKARLTELVQITDTLATEAEAIKWFLVGSTGCEAGNVKIQDCIAGRYGEEPRLVKISFTTTKGGPTKAELAAVCADKLESDGILDPNRTKYGYGTVRVWDNKVKAIMGY